MQVNPKGKDVGEYHVTRGGCWHFTFSIYRPAYRNRDISTTKNGDSGFRVVLGVTNASKSYRKY